MAKSSVRIARSDGDVRRASLAVNNESNMMGTTLFLMIERHVDLDSSSPEHVISNGFGTAQK